MEHRAAAHIGGHAAEARRLYHVQRLGDALCHNFSDYGKTPGLARKAVESTLAHTWTLVKECPDCYDSLAHIVYPLRSLAAGQSKGGAGRPSKSSRSWWSVTQSSRSPADMAARATAALYAVFYPELIGLYVPTWYAQYFLRWLPSWPL